MFANSQGAWAYALPSQRRIAKPCSPPSRTVLYSPEQRQALSAVCTSIEHSSAKALGVREKAVGNVICTSMQGKSEERSWVPGVSVLTNSGVGTKIPPPHGWPSQLQWTPLNEVLFKLLLIIYIDLFESVAVSHQKTSGLQQTSTFSVGEDPTYTGGGFPCQPWRR